MDSNPNTSGNNGLLSHSVTENKVLTLCQNEKIKMLIKKAKKLYDEGKYKRSYQIFKETYKVLKIWAPDADYVVYVLNFLGLASYRLQKCKSALRYFNKVLNKLEKDDPNTPAVLNNKGVILHKFEKYQKAYKLCQDAYTEWKREFGFDHVATLLARHNTAYILQAQNRYDEALEIYLEVYDLRLKKLGGDDPSTLITQYNMAVVFKELGKLEEAFANIRDVFEKQKTKMGLRHSDTLGTWQELETVLSKLEKCDKTLDIYDYLHSGRAAAIGVDIEDAIFMLEKTAEMYRAQSEYHEAFCRYNKLYELQNEKANDSKIMDIRNKIGLLLELQDKNKEALEIFEDLYKKKVGIFGRYGVETLGIQFKIGRILLSDGKMDRALETFDDIYKKRIQTWGVSIYDMCILDTLEQKAFILSRQLKTDEALKVYDDIYSKSLYVYGPVHRHTISIRQTIAELRYRRDMREVLRPYINLH